MAGQRLKKRSWRASVECARPIGEQNNGERGRGDGVARIEERGGKLGDNGSSPTVKTLKN